MRYTSGETVHLTGYFYTGATVTITITQLSTGDEVVSAEACSEIGESGYFGYSYEAPEGYDEYLWTMSDGIDEVSGQFAVDGYPADIASATEIDTQLSETHGSGTWGSDVGLVSKVYTLKDENGSPVAGIQCWATSDEAGHNRIDIVRTTNDLGQVTFQFNLAVGTHVWIWNRGSDEGDEEVI